MTQSSEPVYKIAAYTSDLWEHVCPTLRIVEPVLQAGMQLIKGNEWDNGSVRIHPNDVEDADLVVLQRDFPRNIEAYENVLSYAHRLRKPVIYELDDLLIDIGSDHPDVNAYLETRPSILRAILEADAVTTSTAPLADYLRAFNPDVYVLPNYLIDKYWLGSEQSRRAAQPDSGQVKIGYMGGSGHISDMEMITPVLNRLLARYGERIFIQFWGLRPADELLNQANVNWTHPYLVNYSEFAQYFLEQTCDIAIAPLQDHLFNRCKSGLKYLEYSVLGCPGVYSDLPPYNALVKQGENGYLAANLAEWEAGLCNLIENAGLRQQMGQAARADLERRWLLSKNAYAWKDTYRQILQAYTPERNVQWENVRQLVKKSQVWYIDLARKANSQSLRLTELAANLTNTQAVKESVQAENQGLAQKVAELQEIVNHPPVYEEQVQRLAAAELEQKRLRLKVDVQNTKLGQLEGTIAALRERLAQSNQEVVNANYQLQAVQNTTSWKFTLLLIRMRLRLAPNGSFRMRWLNRLVIALRLWRSQGLRSVLSLTKQRLTTRRPRITLNAPAYTPPASSIHNMIVDGMRCWQPAISMVYAVTPSTSNIETAHMLDWVRRQTWTDLEFVFWDAANGRAWISGDEQNPWDVPNLSRLLEETNGKYICMASPQLLYQRETFLEENLIALESENLAFVVNVEGKPDWVASELWKGLLPGTPSEPLSRMVVNKKCIGDHFKLNLDDWLSDPAVACAVVGKVIFTTANEIEPEGRLVFLNAIENYAIQLVESSIIAARPGVQNTGQALQPIYPIDSVMPEIEKRFELPTVLLFMPFLAVGGAERIALDVIRCLKDEIQFIVLTLDEHDPAIGTTVDLFRELTPYVFNAHDFINHNLKFSLVNYFINRYKPMTLYIANGSPWIYDALSTIKSFHPDLRLVNQVYDHQAGWINRYDPVIVSILDDNIASNTRIMETYLEKGARKEAVSYIENGINQNEFNPDLYPPERCETIKKKLNLPLDAKIVTFMARLHPQKRPMDFIETARRFTDDPTIHFLMVGDGVLGNTIQEEIDRIGLKNITRVPFYRPSSDIFAISDIYVLPSEYEGMPMVLLEAQAMGKPVVVTDVGNNREILEKTCGGIIVDKVGNIGAICLAIRKLLESSPDPRAIRQVILDHNGLDIYKKYKKSLIGS